MHCYGLRVSVLFAMHAIVACISQHALGCNERITTLLAPMIEAADSHAYAPRP